MASKRGIKKDIQYLTKMVITDAIYVSEILMGEEEKQKTDEVILGAIDMYNSLTDRANHPDGKDNPALVKKHYKKISEDLLNKTDELLGTLNKMIE